MAMWVCPHCGAPQAETARCWVCRRSSTACSTCRHFRTSLAADVGYCAKDRWRTPLTGLELRACWEEGRRATAGPGAGLHPAFDAASDLEPEPPGVDPSGQGTERRRWAVVRGDGGPLDRPDPMRLRGFVPIEEVAQTPVGRTADPPTGRVSRAGRARPATPVLGHADLPRPVDDWETRVSLFGETEL